MSKDKKNSLMSCLWTLAVLVLGVGILMVVIRTVGGDSASNACYQRALILVQEEELSEAEKRIFQQACEMKP